MELLFCCLVTNLILVLAIQSIATYSLVIFMDFKGNLNEIIICCAKTLVSDMSHTSELLLPNLINTCYYEGILNLESILYYRVGFNAIRL